MHNLITPQERLRIAAQIVAGLVAPGYMTNNVTNMAVELTDELIEKCGMEVAAGEDASITHQMD